MPYLSPIERRMEKRLTQQITERVRLETAKRTALNMVVRLIDKRFGQLESAQELQISQLSTEQIKKLSENLLDFNSLADLDTWLEANPPEGV